MIDGYCGPKGACVIDNRTSRSSKAFRRALLVSVALGPLLLANPATLSAQAVINDGTPDSPPPVGPCEVAGSDVTCTGDVSDGIEISTGALRTTLRVYGVTQNVAPPATYEGIYFRKSNGDINIDSDLGPYSITATNAAGIFASTSNGDISLTSAGNVTSPNEAILSYVLGPGSLSITSTGDLTVTSSSDPAVSAFVSGGVGSDLEINIIGNILNDDSGPGIDADANGGDITVSVVGDITTRDGTFSQGIDADASGEGDIKISVVGDITTRDGTFSQGIDADANDGDITISVTGDITTLDEEGIEADANGDGDVTISVTGNITALGDEGIDADTDGNGDITITTVGNIRTFADSGEGIRVTPSSNTTTGETIVNSTGNITTSGDRAEGIDIFTAGLGDITVIHEGNINTIGESAQAIDVFGCGGDLYVRQSGNVTTTGYSAEA
ncbi:MAG: hypothetical protein QNJ62_08390, partial [Methyloceanibacter sp.]|nr:hypothetical protein [Methyloceanibacter sp.]